MHKAPKIYGKVDFEDLLYVAIDERNLNPLSTSEIVFKNPAVEWLKNIREGQNQTLLIRSAKKFMGNSFKTLLILDKMFMYFRT